MPFPMGRAVPKSWLEEPLRNTKVSFPHTAFHHPCIFKGSCISMNVCLGKITFFASGLSVKTAEGSQSGSISSHLKGWRVPFRTTKKVFPGDVCDSPACGPWLAHCLVRLTAQRGFSSGPFLGMYFGNSTSRAGDAHSGAISYLEHI